MAHHWHLQANIWSVLENKIVLQQLHHIWALKFILEPIWFPHCSRMSGECVRVPLDTHRVLFVILRDWQLPLWHVLLMSAEAQSWLPGKHCSFSRLAVAPHSTHCPVSCVHHSPAGCAGCCWCVRQEAVAADTSPELVCYNCLCRQYHLSHFSDEDPKKHYVNSFSQFCLTHTSLFSSGVTSIVSQCLNSSQWTLSCSGNTEH